MYYTAQNSSINESLSLQLSVNIHVCYLVIPNHVNRRIYILFYESTAYHLCSGDCDLLMTTANTSCTCRSLITTEITARLMQGEHKSRQYPSNRV